MLYWDGEEGSSTSCSTLWSCEGGKACGGGFPLLGSDDASTCAWYTKTLWWRFSCTWQRRRLISCLVLENTVVVVFLYLAATKPQLVLGTLTRALCCYVEVAALFPSVQ